MASFHSCKVISYVWIRPRKGALSGTTISTIGRKEITAKALKSASSSSPDVTDKAKCVALLDERHHLQALCDHQNAGDAAKVKARLLVRYFIRHDGCHIAHTKASKLSSLAFIVAGIVLRNCLFVAIMMYVLYFTVGSQKENGVSFVATKMIDSFDDMLVSNIPESNCPQTYYCYIQIAKFFQWRAIILGITEQINKKKTGNRTLGFPNFYKAALFTSWTEHASLSVRAASDYTGNSRKHLLFHSPFFIRAETVFCASFMGVNRSVTQPGVLHSPRSSPNLFSQTKQKMQRWNVFVCNTIRMHAYDQSYKTAIWKIRSKQRQQRLIHTVINVLHTTSPELIIDLNIGHNVSQAAHVLQMRKAKILVFTRDPEIREVDQDGSDNDIISSVGKLRSHRRKVSRHGVVKQNAELVSTASRTKEVNFYINTTAHLSSTTGSFRDLWGDVLPVGSISEICFKDGVSWPWLRSAGRVTDSAWLELRCAVVRVCVYSSYYDTSSPPWLWLSFAGRCSHVARHCLVSGDIRLTFRSLSELTK